MATLTSNIKSSVYNANLFVCLTVDMNVDYYLQCSKIEVNPIGGIYLLNVWYSECSVLGLHRHFSTYNFEVDNNTLFLHLVPNSGIEVRINTIYQPANKIHVDNDIYHNDLLRVY